MVILYYLKYIIRAHVQHLKSQNCEIKRFPQGKQHILFQEESVVLTAHVITMENALIIPEAG